MSFVATFSFSHQLKNATITKDHVSHNQLSMQAIDDVHQLVEQAKEDTTAFGNLYEQFFDKVYHFFFYRTGDQDVSYDLSAATFEKVLKKLNTFRPQKNVPFEAWLFRIARNQLIDRSRREKHRDYVPLEKVSPIFADNTPSPHDKAEQSHQFQQIQQAIQHVPEKYREVLYLRFFDELSNQEIGSLLGRTKEQIALEVFRGLKKLKSIILDQNPTSVTK